MSKYIITDSQNRVLRIETSETLPDPGQGLVATLLTSNFPGFPRHAGVFIKFENGQFTREDTRPIESLKLAKNEEINRARLAANQSFFVFQGKNIACDPLSRSDIDGVNGIVSLTGTLPANFPGAWKAMDNSFVLIPDRNTWISFYDAMINQGVVNFNRSQQLKAQLALATTAEQIEAIVW